MQLEHVLRASLHFWQIICKIRTDTAKQCHLGRRQEKPPCFKFSVVGALTDLCCLLRPFLEGVVEGKQLGTSISRSPSQNASLFNSV